VPKIVAEWKEPDTVKYPSGDPYVIYVMDRSSVWDESKRYRYCTIGIVPQKNKDLSGAWTEYEFHNYNNDPTYFSRCIVSWEAEGITITEPTGHKLFIPKNAFIEGR